MSLIAYVGRPRSFDLALFVHVLGAMTMTGGVVLAAVSFVANRGGASAVLARLGLRSLLFAAIPGYVVMRIAAEWVIHKEHIPDDSKWIGIGYMVADPSLLLLIIAAVVAWRSSKRANAGEPPRAILQRVPLGLSGLLVVMYVVAIFAMTTKPV
jgi:hypothetical protein